MSYPYRWLLQFSFTLSLATTGIVMVGFSPVAELVADIYDCSMILVEAQMVIFIFVFIPSNFIVIHLQNKYGLRVTLLTAASFILFGAWFRMLLIPTNKFWLVCIGSVFAAFGQVCYLNSVSKISSTWFADN